MVKCGKVWENVKVAMVKCGKYESIAMVKSAKVKLYYLHSPLTLYKVHYYDAKTSGDAYQIGDRVWRESHSRKKGTSSKLSAKWEGPYEIIKKITDVVYRLKKEKGRKRVVVHFNCLKRCFSKDEKKHDTKNNERTGLTPNQPVHNKQEPSVQPQKKKLQPNEDDDSDEEWIVETRSSRNASTTNLNGDSYSSVVQRPAPSQPARSEDTSAANPNENERTSHSEPDDVNQDIQEPNPSEIERPSYSSVLQRPRPLTTPGQQVHGLEQRC